MLMSLLKVRLPTHLPLLPKHPFKVGKTVTKYLNRRRRIKVTRYLFDLVNKFQGKGSLPRARY